MSKNKAELIPHNGNNGKGAEFVTNMDNVPLRALKINPGTAELSR